MLDIPAGNDYTIHILINYVYEIFMKFFIKEGAFR